MSYPSITKSHDEDSRVYASSGSPNSSCPENPHLRKPFSNKISDENNTYHFFNLPTSSNRSISSFSDLGDFSSVGCSTPVAIDSSSCISNPKLAEFSTYSTAQLTLEAVFPSFHDTICSLPESQEISPQSGTTQSTLSLPAPPYFQSANLPQKMSDSPQDAFKQLHLSRRPDKTEHSVKESLGDGVLQKSSTISQLGLFSLNPAGTASLGNHHTKKFSEIAPFSRNDTVSPKSKNQVQDFPPDVPSKSSATVESNLVESSMKVRSVAKYVQPQSSNVIKNSTFYAGEEEFNSFHSATYPTNYGNFQMYISNPIQNAVPDEPSESNSSEEINAPINLHNQGLDQTYTTNLEFKANRNSCFSYEQDCKIYHPQPLMPHFQRGSLISVASSNILDYFDCTSISYLSESDQFSTGDSKFEQSISNNGPKTTAYYQAALAHQKKLSKENLVSNLIVKSQFRNLHLSPPLVIDKVTGKEGSFYPAPIPAKLRLPPLLSQRNISRIESGRLISRRQSTVRTPGGVVQFPNPPVWNMDLCSSSQDLCNSPLTPRLTGESNSVSSLEEYTLSPRKVLDKTVSKSSVDSGSDRSLSPKSKPQFPALRIIDPDSANGQATKSNKSELIAEIQPIMEVSEKILDCTIPSYPLYDSAMSDNKFITEETEISKSNENDYAINALNGNGNKSRRYSKKGQEGSDSANSDQSYDSTYFGGRIGELKDESWGVFPTYIEREYPSSLLNDCQCYLSAEEIVSDCATIPSDEEYQDDIYVNVKNIDEVMEELMDKDMHNFQFDNLKSSNFDDLAFTSFNPNNAITDHGLLAGSVAYSSRMIPAVGIQPYSLVEEIEMRKSVRTKRVQKMHFDTQGSAIATEIIETNENPDIEFIRLPTSGHPLDGRHNKSLLELQNNANKDYEDQKLYHYLVGQAAETDRLSKLGILSETTSIMLQKVQNLEEDDPDETLGARRMRLREKRQKRLAAEKEAEREMQDQFETLAQRRARLKKERLEKKLKNGETVLDIKFPSTKISSTGPLLCHSNVSAGNT